MYKAVVGGFCFTWIGRVGVGNIVERKDTFLVYDFEERVLRRIGFRIYLYDAGVRVIYDIFFFYVIMISRRFYKDGLGVFR